jgi:hypothetical protein
MLFGQNVLADKETFMKASIVALCAALAFGSVDFVAPSIAEAAPVLTCLATPGGTATSPSCSSNIPTTHYNVRWQVTGLPAGTYTYSWSSVKPGLVLPCADFCDIGVDMSPPSVDWRDTVTLVATNTVTSVQYTLSAHALLMGVCAGPAGGYAFC